MGAADARPARLIDGKFRTRNLHGALPVSITRGLRDPIGRA
jgi:hypothetical protein